MDKNTLDKINALTRRKFKAEELYTFPVVLCHNDIDRDYERFSDEALDKMAELFVGTTGIFDHNPTADNQSARIYDTEVVTDPEKQTAWGGTYRYLNRRWHQERGQRFVQFCPQNVFRLRCGRKQRV